MSSLLKLMKTADYAHKSSILEGILMLHAQDEFADNLAHMVIKALSNILNDQKDYPTCMMEDQKNFIIIALKAMQKLSLTPDKEFVSEMLMQFLDGDKEVRYDCLKTCLYYENFKGIIQYTVMMIIMLMM